MRAFDLPAGSDEERDCMVREELHSENETALEEICFDSWMSEGSSPSSASSAQVSVVALPRKSIEKLAEQLGRAGLDCVVLDGLPCALARALAIGPDAGSQPAIALDMGAASATLVLAQGGRPLFARQLRGCGLDAFLTPLVERLSLAPEEARHLLFHVGIAPAATNPSGASAPNATHQLLGEPVAHLKNELRRTLGYMDQRLRSHLPHEIVLLGGGALIPNLASGIASETGIPTRLWRLGEASGSPSDPVYGVATALSLLAWENPPCI
jgi:Tfp pilus assembly PilM family ATPase